jgi:putative DNA primase/helicase
VVTPEVFDKDELLFNCLNGTINLATGQLRPHSPDDNLTKIAPVNYNPEAVCPLWDDAILRSMGGDEEMVGFLRRVAGYVLTGSVQEHCMFLLYGTGRNGKTLLLDALLGVVGRDYGMMAPNHLLTSCGRKSALDRRGGFGRQAASGNQRTERGAV